MYAKLLYFVIALALVSIKQSFCDNHQYAVVKIPVADTAGSALGSAEKYNQLAFAPHNGDHLCPRFHQLLFNEVVRIVREKGDEIEAELLNVFYHDVLGRKLSTFWTLKKNLVYLDKIKESTVLKAIPEPYTFDIAKDKPKSNQVLALTWPWYDCNTKKFYSAGTRFVRNAKGDTKEAYSIILLNNEFVPVISSVKKSYALVSSVNQNSPEQKIKKFVALLKFWVAQNKKQNVNIPYVWGGCSFVKVYSDSFSLEKDTKNGVYVESWMRPEKLIPYSGIECSSLIFRAAQICQMPYYFKNSSTLAARLDHIASDDTIQDGDIIWYPGHVLIVSDSKNNKIIESAGYALGYGRVHEASLEKIFKNIKTFSKLKEAFFNKAQLIRLGSEGKDFKIIKQFKVLKIRSIWKK